MLIGIPPFDEITARLDPIKGMDLKLDAFELLLKKHPEWVGKVALIQIAVPSREAVADYKQLKKDLDIKVGFMNYTYAALGDSPVRFLYRSVPFAELAALYRLADAVVVTSIRDGMNLVCQEYVSCQQGKYGVLILSEFAGAARCLGTSLRVNPWNLEETADAMHRALTMEMPERITKFEQMHKWITKHSTQEWGKSFVTMMHDISRQKLVARTPVLTTAHLDASTSSTGSSPPITPTTPTILSLIHI